MTPTPRPDTHRPQSTDVHWFGASRRLLCGVPDSSYGWLDLPDGPCIVKAMDPDLTVYNQTLLEHERKVLARLQALGAPVPALVDLGRPDWLATRFGGLSMQRLEHVFAHNGTDPREAFPLAERLAVWVQLLRRLQPLAERGVWVIDLYEANVVVPLTEGVQGQLRLRDPMLIDHAHTLEAGMDMRRPLGLNYKKMARIPPELHQALQQDEDALEAHFEAAGVPLPSYSRLPGDGDQLSRRMWAEYSAPQALQRLLDANQLNAGQGMQYAVATAMKRLLEAFADMPCRLTLEAVIARMAATQPAQRYPTLNDAAAELDALMPPLPLASRQRYGPLQPADLQTPEQTAASALVQGTAQAASAEGAGDAYTRTAEELANAVPTARPAGVRPGHGSSSAAPATDRVPPLAPTAAAAGRPPRRPGVPTAWGWWAAALGAALGMALPLPW